MKLLFLDQSGKLGGAELCLLDIARPYRENCLVGLLADGTFRTALEQAQISVQVFTSNAIAVRKESGWLQGLMSLAQLIPITQQITQRSHSFDVIYANTQKALVVGAIASRFSHRPLVYHLHDIVSPEHFSASNRRVIVTLANCCAKLVIANSQAAQAAFVQAGGQADLTQVVYNGFDPQQYLPPPGDRAQVRQALGLAGRFVVGHFSRLSPWKGQHVLLEALQHCPADVVAVFIGDALFGEEAYVAQLHQQVADLGLTDRVKFLGFRSDVPALMAACDLVAHTSTAPEPFGRVIVEAMLSGTPVIASAAGGAIELVDHGHTGWLVPPGDADKLAVMINHCYTETAAVAAIAHQAQKIASQRFNLATTNQQIADQLKQVVLRSQGS